MHTERITLALSDAEEAALGEVAAAAGLTVDQWVNDRVQDSLAFRIPPTLRERFFHLNIEKMRQIHNGANAFEEGA